MGTLIDCCLVSFRSDCQRRKHPHYNQRDEAMAPMAVPHARSLGHGIWNDDVFFRSAQKGPTQQQQQEEDWSDAAVQNVSRLWNLSDINKARLIELGMRLQDIAHPKNCPSEVVRFLLDRSGNVRKAEQVFRAMIQWRLRVGADTILQDYRPPQPLIDNIPGAVLQDYDKEGDPIFFDRVAECDCVQLIHRYGPQELVRHSIWIRELTANSEWVEAYKQRQGRAPRQIIIISDMNALSRKHLHPKVLTTFGEIMRIDQDNYPGTAKK